MSSNEPYNWAGDLMSGFVSPETTKISDEKNPYRRGSLVSSSFVQSGEHVDPRIAETIEHATQVIMDQQSRRIESACRSAVALGCGVLAIESEGVLLYAAPCKWVPEMEQYVWQHTGSSDDLQSLVNSVYHELRARKSADDEDGAATSAP